MNQIGTVRRRFTAYSHPIAVSSNSTVTGFQFNGTTKQIRFTVGGALGTSGSCNITFPKQMLGEPYTVLLDHTPITPTVTSNATHMSFYLTYTHSLHLVEIVGTTAIPEFATIISTMLLLTLLTVTLLFTKKMKFNQHFL